MTNHEIDVGWERGCVGDGGIVTVFDAAEVLDARIGSEPAEGSDAAKWQIRRIRDMPKRQEKRVECDEIDVSVCAKMT